MKSADLPCMRADRRRVWDWSAACRCRGRNWFACGAEADPICFDEPETDPYFSIGRIHESQDGIIVWVCPWAHGGVRTLDFWRG
jgi:hypothetical protein